MKYMFNDLITSYIYYSVNNLLCDMTSSSSSKRQNKVVKIGKGKSHVVVDDVTKQQYVNQLQQVRWFTSLAQMKEYNVHFFI